VITIQEEKFTVWSYEAEDIFEQHWQALGLDKEQIKCSIDYERYHQMEAMDMIHCLVARHEGKVVGYIINFLIRHMHYKDSGTMALVDMYFILPEYRRGGLGARMFKMMEQQLIARSRALPSQL
jgi:GNAT superfamily N-acetyltransferase